MKQERRPAGGRMLLSTEICPAARVSRQVEDEMYALFARAYDATDRSRFHADLGTKRDVILLRDATGRVAGFTTLAVFEDEDRGRAVRIVFSGDTIVDPRYWGSNALNFAWVRHVAHIKAEQPEQPLFWLLISKGFRTYRYLSTFARHFIPGSEQEGDPALEALRDRLARRLFGPAYVPAPGIVAWDPPRDRPKEALARLPDTGRAAAQARFFEQQNPGWRRGEELVCLCSLDVENMPPFTRRLYQRALV